MTIIDTLREQITELHKLLELKNKRIAELEIMLAVPRPIINLPFGQNPIVTYSDTTLDSNSTKFDQNGVRIK